ncbi:hypothetical protein MEPL4_7c01120 [Melissococcus plutonius]|nr:hypothetical protein MEPL_178p000610 [Melissococcus plutonius S1]KMT23515.1 hypothetical protein MEPL2_5c00250 [Melissococcus plutonius]KMT23689.1 hypothetical protein MEPL3_9c00900 [Melissococcus plutonius]KMT23796.1 hypothetical protein MEPL1_11c00800 [Melissococcus plutonius]KMT28149.1 hypothetical protein MEPL4_7c01120 [Melissococcus plutonius]
MKITVYFKNFITFNIQCTFNKINIFFENDIYLFILDLQFMYNILKMAHSE